MAFTYAQLKTAIQASMETDETTFVANLPVFIRNSEERIFKSSQLNLFRKSVTDALTQDDKFFDVPADFLASFALSIDVDGETVFLEQKDVSFLQEYWSFDDETDTPKFYAQFDNTRFLVAPTPDEAYPVELHYFYRPVSLTEGAEDGTTWLSLNAFDALLYGSLVEAAIFQRSEDNLLARFETRFMEALSRMKNLGEAMQTIDQFRYGLLRTKRS